MAWSSTRFFAWMSFAVRGREAIRVSTVSGLNKYGGRFSTIDSTLLEALDGALRFRKCPRAANRLVVGPFASPGWAQRVAGKNS